MRYLITGGAGFIGSHLGEALIGRGDEVISVDDLSTGNSANVEALRSAPNFTEIVGSVLDPSLMSELVEQVDIVVHLAAAVGVKLITEHPLRSLETNVGGRRTFSAHATAFARPCSSRHPPRFTVALKGRSRKSRSGLSALRPRRDGAMRLRKPLTRLLPSHIGTNTAFRQSSSASSIPWDLDRRARMAWSYRD